MKSDVTPAGCFLLLLSLPLLIVLGSVANGVAILANWNWFAVPIFNAPKLTLVTAIGLGCVIAPFRNHSTSESDENKSIERKIFDVFVSIAVINGMIILMGYVVHLFM